MAEDQELELGEDGRTAEEAPCICAHGTARVPGTYAECDPRCGKCYWDYQDALTTSLDY